MRGFLKYIAMVFVLCLGFASAAKAETWIKAETDNFIVYSNINQQVTNSYVTKLEQFRFLLNQFYLSKEQQALPAPKMKVYLTRSRIDFREVRPSLDSDVAGFVITGCTEGLSAFVHFDGDRVSLTAPVQNQIPSFSLEVLLHEYVHLFMAQNSAMAEPRWYIEGVAEYYSTMLYNNTDMVLGYGSAGRLYSLQDGGSIKYEEILRDDPKLRLDAYQDKFYAQSWLLTNYILHNNERAAKLPSYFEARNKGEDPVLAFERIFGIKMKDLPGVLRVYLNTEKTKGFKINRMPTINVKSETLPRSADKLLLLDAALKACPSEEYWPKLMGKIQAEAQKHPDDEFAKEVVARAHVLIGDEALALDHYKALVAVRPNDENAHFFLGQTYYLMAQHDKLIEGKTKEQQIAMARTAFGRSYQLQPLNPVNLYYYSKTAERTNGFPDESSLNAATEAYVLAPSNNIYAFNAATLLIFKENYEDARTVLTSIANNSHAKSKAPQIERAIAAIDAKKSKREILSALSNSGDNSSK